MSIAIVAALLLQGAAPSRPPPSNTDLPAWSKTPSQAEMTAAYPAQAMALNLAGSAMVECTVGGAGELKDCAVSGESIPNFGFGAAALTLAPKFQIPTKAPSGATMVGRTVQFPMRWLNSAKTQAEPAIVYDDAGRNGSVVFNCRVKDDRSLDNCVFIDAKPPGTALLRPAGEAAMRQKAPVKAKPGDRLAVVIQIKSTAASSPR
jgi:TonB family protein